MNSLDAVATNNLKTYSTQASAEDREKLQKDIRELVGQVFFGTMLKQMRSEQNKANPLNGGQMGQTFMTQLDQTLISKMSESKGFAIGQEIAEAWTGENRINVDAVKAKYQTQPQEQRTWIQN
jgi:Rod binding domain-containing protein